MGDGKGDDRLMGIALSVFKAQVDNIVYPAQTGIDTSIMLALSRDRAVKGAVENYSVDRPSQIAADVTGDGGKYYGIVASLISWIEGFSRIIDVQYPAAVVASDDSPVYVDRDEWIDDYFAGGLRYLYLTNAAPANTEKMRITYTVPYLWIASAITTAQAATAHGFTVGDYLYLETATWTEATDSRIATHIVTIVPDGDNYTRAELMAAVSPGDFFAICHLAAALVCEELAVKYSSTNDETILTDSVNHVSRGQAFAARAVELRKLYTTHMRISTGDSGSEAKPAGTFVDMDSAPGWPTGRRYIFH